MPRYRKTLAPRTRARNSPIVESASKARVFFSSRSRHETDNAIKASGITARVYLSKRAGVKCTCFGKETTVLDLDGNLPDAVLEGLFSPDTAPIAPKPEPTKDETYDDLDGNNTFSMVDDTPEVISIDSDGVATTEPVTVNADGFSVDQDDFIEYLEDDMGFTSESANRCGVCFGIGWVGGYSLFRGNRQVLAVGTENSMTGSTYINKDVSPHKFSAEGLDEVTVAFQMTVPYGAKIISYKLVNNTDIIPEEDYSAFVVDRVENPVMTMDTLATGRPILLRIKSNEEFTHLELSYNTQGVNIPVDIEQLSTGAFSKSFSDSDVEGTMHIHSDVQQLTKHSILKDSKYGRMWYVKNVTPHQQNTTSEVITWSADVRLIQPHEIFALLT